MTAMRYLLFLAMLALFGCGPGPKSAKADDKTAAPKKETYTAAIQRFEATVSGLSATLGNNNAELDAVKGELSAVKADVNAIKAGVAEIKSLLTVDTEISVEVPKVESPPAEPDAVTINGKSENLAAFIKKWYRPNTGFHDPDDGQVLSEHLVKHGVAAEDVARLNYATQHVLHVAVHLREKAEGIPAPKAKAVVVKAAAPVVSVPIQNCPNGQCPNIQQYGVKQGRARLFGRWR